MVRRISLLSFAFGFADAFLLYLFSSYFHEASGRDNVSLFYLLPFGVILVSLFYFHAWIEKVGKVVLLTLLLFFLVLSSFAMQLLPPGWHAMLVLMGILVLINLVWVNLDAILESFSSDRHSGRIRGLYLTIMNAGFLLAPYIALRILDRHGFEGIFFTAMLIFSTVLVVALVTLRRVNQRYRERIRPRQIIQKVRGREDILRVYGISFALEFAFAIMVVYVPIRLAHLGMPHEGMGIVFTCMLLPFVLLQYPLGRMADMRIGEKEGLIASLVLMAVTATLVTFLGTASVLWWAIVLFATRVGYASLEVLRDSYFYKRIDGEDGDIIAFFRTARPVANLVAACLAGVLLIYAPLHSVFLLVSLVSFLCLFPALRLDDNHSERELARP